MRPRIKKNDVLYIDRHIAIVDHKGVQMSAANDVQWLLKIGTNKRDETPPIREFLERCVFQPKKSLCIQGVTASDISDVSAVNALGYKVKDTQDNPSEPPAALRISESFDAGSPFAGHPFGGDEIGRYCVDLSVVKEAASAVRYISRLALLALGDARAADCIHLFDAESPEALLRFDVLVPSSIVGDIDVMNERLSNLGFADIRARKPKTEGATLLSCVAVRSNYYHGIDNAFPADDNERKRIAANVLLAALADASLPAQYRPDPNSCLPQLTTQANLITAVIDLARSGKLAGCPLCGLPVVKPHESSDPYCRKSHRTRTDEKRGE